MAEEVNLLEKALDVLESLALTQEEMSLTELSLLTEINKSSLYRLLKCLVGRKFVNKSPNKKYSIGYKFIQIAAAHLDTLELVTTARPYLIQLARELKLTTHLGILDHASVAYLEKIDTYSNTNFYTEVGRRSPVHCSSLGKCLLAGLSGDRLKKELSGYRFERFTEKTIKNFDELIEELREVRRLGYASDNEEFKPNHRCIATFVYDYSGSCVAAISASGTCDEINIENKALIISLLKKTANEISKRLGYET